MSAANPLNAQDARRPLHFEVTRLPDPSFLVRVEDDHGNRVCDCYAYQVGEALVVENMHGALTCPAQWFAAVAEHFPSAEHIHYKRGSAVLGNITDHELKVR